MSFDFQATSTTGSESSNASMEGANPTTMGKPSVFYRLRDLFISDNNVRKNGEPPRIPEMMALIDAQGLMQALHVTPEKDAEGNRTGRGGVEAGGRRYRALMLRVTKGKGSLDDLIECKEVEPGEAVEVSMIENISQAAMHPADEFKGYKKMKDEGRSVDAIAHTFGVPKKHVLRRLRLASVAPALMDLFCKGSMDLDQVTALASVEDQERQVATWNALSPHSRSAGNIKRKLSEFSVAVDDPRVKVIGLQNYLKLGGGTDVDLFSTNGADAKTLSDVGLVEWMLGEALEKQVAEVLEEGWQWVESFSDYGHDEQRRFVQLPKVYKPETKAQAAQRTALEGKHSELEDKLEAMEDDGDSTWQQQQAVENELEALDSQIEALKEARVDPDAFDKTTSGAVVAFRGEAGIVVLRGLVLRTAAVSTSGGTSGGSFVQAKAPKPEFPEKLMLNLTSHRTAAVQASMLGNQAVSLAAMANTLALSMFDYTSVDSPLKINLRECDGDLKRNSDTMEGSRAALQIAAATEAWEAKLPKNRATWFAWFLAQPQAVVLDFIVYAAALSTNAMHSIATPDAAADELADALALDMTQWWEAGPATYFDLVPKSKLAAIVRETSTEEAAQALEKMKKDDAVAQAVAHTTGKAWLPMPLRPTAARPVAAVATPGADQDYKADEEDGTGE